MNDGSPSRVISVPWSGPEHAHHDDAADDAEPPGKIDGRSDQLRDHEAADADAVAEAQVDLGEQQDERLGRAEDDEDAPPPRRG